MASYYAASLRADGSGRLLRLFMFDHMPEPLPADAIELTADQHAEWLANLHTRALHDGKLEVVPTDLVVSIPQTVVVDRLIAAGKLRQTYAHLQMDAPATALSDAQLAQRERWRSRPWVRSDDPDEIAMLTAIAADPAVILAPV